MFTTIPPWIKYLFISILVYTLQTKEVKAQFSYAGFHLGYTWTNIDGEGGYLLGDNSDPTRINQLTATLNFIHRPIRRLGLGMSINIPVAKGFSSVFENSDFSDIASQYSASEIEYKVENRVGATLIARLFFSDESSFYVDFRYTLASVNETFVFQRSASSGLAAENINHDENYSARGPGFELGGLAQFDSHFYLNYGFIMDFINYDTDSFSYSIESSGGSIDQINSLIAESSLSYMIHYGIGYRF